MSILGARLASTALVRGHVAIEDEPPQDVELLGSWPLNETSSSFGDVKGSNNGTLIDPRGYATHVRGKPAAMTTGAGSVQLSNQYIEIALVSAYQLANVSLVGWFPALDLQADLGQ